MTRDFKTLFLTQFLGAFNDNIFKNALVILITFNSVNLFGLEPKLLVPLAGGLFIFPFFIFSGTAGQIADRYEKRHLIKLIKLAEILIMSLAAISFYKGSYELLFLTLFLMGGQSAFFGPLKYGIIPSLVAPHKLVAANAFISAGTFIAILLGTILGGFLAGISGAPYYLIFTILMVSVIGLMSSMYFSTPKESSFLASEQVKVDYTLIRSTWTILKETMKDRLSFVMILQISWFWFVGAAILSLLPLMVKTSLGLGSEVATFFLALFTIGMGLGSLMTQKISHDKAQLGLVPISALGVSFLLFLCYFGLKSKEIISCSVAVLLVSAFGGCFMVTLITALQEVCDHRKLSRIVAGNNIWNALFMVSASICVMILTSHFSIATTVLIFALFCFFSSLLFYSLATEESIRQWLRFFCHLLYKVEVTGLENLPDKGRLIIVSNHVSFVDWLVLSAVVRRPIRYVIDWSYYYMSFLPFWFKQAKLIPIATKKESVEVLEKAFLDIGRNLEEGAVLGIFAEGWLTRDGQMRALQPGVDKIIKRHPTPIVLVAIDGLWGSFFSHSGSGVFKKIPKLSKRHLRVTVSQVIEAQDYDRQQARQWFIKTVSHYDA